MGWVTYQGSVVNGRIKLPSSVVLPDKATVLVTVLDERRSMTHIRDRSQIDAMPAQGDDIQRQRMLLEEARALRERMKAEGVNTDSTEALNQTREERSDEFLDLR